VLITNAEIGSAPGLDVRLSRTVITEIGAGLHRDPGEPVLDAAGGALLPGLHDHHLHLRALVAAQASVDVTTTSRPEDFDRTVASAAQAFAHDRRTAGRSLRVIGWNDLTSGPLDRYRLDALTGSVPARVQHASGALWVLNSIALREAGVPGSQHQGVERDDSGEPTGRLFRMDSWLRDRLGTRLPAERFRAELGDFARKSARLGITGFTDATPGRDQSEVDELAELSVAGVLPQRLHLMAPPGLRPPACDSVTLGPAKLLLDDATLPRVADLAETIRDLHAAGSRAAVHCVSAEQLIVACEAVRIAGPAGDRIEHASIVPPGYPAQLSRLGLCVVTQPGFIGSRGDTYLRDVPAPEQDWLYPCASLIRAGVPVAAGTDAPYGPADPWRCVADAITRRTPAGRVLGPAEQVSPRQALAMFFAAAADPRQVRLVSPGQPADLCILRLPLDAALAAPSAECVLATVAKGEIVSVG
jgi:predicted amidohydrolase YtcJ